MKELAYYKIGDSLGWNQDWFVDWWMNIGGCAAVTACDLALVLRSAGQGHGATFFGFGLCDILISLGLIHL